MICSASSSLSHSAAAAFRNAARSERVNVAFADGVRARAASTFSTATLATPRPRKAPRGTCSRPATCAAVRFSSTSASGSAKTSQATATGNGASLPESPIPIFTTVQDVRQWRARAMAEGKSVGFVPTMGALHEGHVSLVRASLAENDYTVMSIFVNPAQFAPTEDLGSYPRTLGSDLKALESLSSSGSGFGPGSGKGVSAVFLPSVKEMYPSGLTQDVKAQVGAFVEVAGLQNMMEGASRPTFFRGVATVVTKLFNVVQPDRAYFGQKDIQQAIILRRLVSDLLFAYPPSSSAVRVLPTAREPESGLALSSRNAYLTPAARSVAPVLYRALSAGRDVWDSYSFEQDGKHGKDGDGEEKDGRERVIKTLEAARKVVRDEAARCASEGGRINLQLDYISLNDPSTLQDLEPLALALAGGDNGEGVSLDTSRGAILSGAALVSEGKEGKVTRLIDNFLLGFRL